MDIIQSMDLKLRRHIHRLGNFIVPLVSKTKITKIRVGENTLGYRIYSFFNKVLNFKPPEPIEVGGMIMYYRSPDGRDWFGWCYAFDFEPETRCVFEQIVKPGTTVVDVGAHIGYYTLLAAKLVGEEGKVYAFEPDPAYYTLLKKNIEANRLSANIETFKVAVGNTEKKATLFLGISTSSSLFKIRDITDQTDIVDVLSLDKFFADRGWPLVHVIKIDIEGAEKIALEGMHELVKKNRDLKLIIELNPSFLNVAGTSAAELLGVLSELSFNRIRVLSGETRSYRIPQDIGYLANLGEKSIVNLLCERHP